MTDTFTKLELHILTALTQAAAEDRLDVAEHLLRAFEVLDRA